MKRFKALAVLLVVLCFLFVSACSNSTGGASDTSGSGEDNGKQSGGSDEPVTLRYAMWDKTQAPMLKKIIKEFHKTHSNIKVKLEKTPYDAYFTKLNAAATGGNLPDVFWMNGPNFVKYASNDMLLPISQMIKEDGLDLSPYPKGLIGLYTYNEKHYALPKDYDSIGLWYNKKLFDEAGLSYPDKSWDWDKLVSAAKKLTDKSKGIYGFGAFMQDPQATYYNVILENGGSIISKDKKSSGFDDPATIEGLKKYWNMIHKYHVSPTQAQFETTDATALFESGKVAMIFEASYMVPEFKKNEYTKKNADVAVLPKMETRTCVIHGLGNVISTDTKHPKAAWEFVKFLSSKKAAKIQAEAGIIPAYEGTQQAWVKATPTFNLQAFLDMAKLAKPYPVSVNTSEWSSIAKKYIAKAWAGQMSVKQAANTIDKEMEEILSQE